MVIDLAASRCPRSKPDWALWPAVPASCTADDEAGYGAPSTPRFQPGCDAWCGSSRDKRLHRSEWQRPPPGLCRRSAPSADDRARSVAQRHSVHAPARGGPGKARLAACADTAKPAAHLARKIREKLDAEAPFCYKHGVKAVFEARNEASACLKIAQHSVCCSPRFSPSPPCCSLIN